MRPVPRPDRPATPLSVESAETIGRGASRTDGRREPLASASPREEAALHRVKTLSRLMDEAIRVPGTSYRIGIDPIVGVLPVGGDALMAAIGLYPVAEAYRLGVPTRTLAWMLGRVALDATVGSIPVLGGLFDAAYKANELNARTLENHLRGG